MIGQPAVDISHFLVEQGADASLYERSGGDDWAVVFNPRILKRSRIVLARDAHLYPYDFAPVREQLQALAAQAAASPAAEAKTTEPATTTARRPRT